MSEKIDLAKEEKIGSSYELTLILSQEKDYAGIVELVKFCGGQISKEENLGLKRFAYEIKKLKEGYYYRITFGCEGQNVAKISSELSREKDLVRYLIVNALRESEEASKHQRTPRENVRNQSAEIAKQPKQEIIERQEKALIQKEDSVKTVATSQIEKENEDQKEVAKTLPKEEEPAKETTKAAPKKEKAPSKSKEAKVATKKPVRKAQKADTSDLDKKLEELVKED